MVFFENVALGLETALSLNNLMYCFLGVLIGMVVGIIPGIGTLAAMSILFPITFYLDSTAAIIMLAGIWYGSSYGGNTTSILLNIPGTPANAITCLDGYPMARQGKGGIAILMTTAASFIGGSFGIILLMLFTPVISSYALKFGPAEYFSLMLFGLVAGSVVSESTMAKGISMVILGMLLGTVGMDMYTGVQRFTFSNLNLMDGISLVVLAMSLFGISEIISSVGKLHFRDINPESAKFRAMRPSKSDIRKSWLPVVRGSSVGAFFGTLPGTGTTISAFLAYALEKRISRHPEKFGKGAIEGIMAPESANNAADQTSFIPTLGLGVPGSPTMALVLGALIVHGINPGPNLISEQPSLFWGLIMSFWLGNVMLVFLNVPLIGIWVRFLFIPYHLLYPSILVFICIGAYSLRFSAFDVIMVAFVGSLGYFLRFYNFSAAPLLLGFVLGPLVEENFRRAMILSRGDLFFLVERPISLFFISTTVLILLWGLWGILRNR